MTQIVTKIKWNEANFLWNSNPYTWDEVQLVQEIEQELDGDSSESSVAKIVDELPKEKKEKLIHLVMRKKGIKVYDKMKTTKDVAIAAKDVKLLIKDVKAFITAENIDV